MAQPETDIHVNESKVSRNASDMDAQTRRELTCPQCDKVDNTVCFYPARLVHVPVSQGGDQLHMEHVRTEPTGAFQCECTKCGVYWKLPVDE